MSLPQVIWFANSHEHSLHYIKFGLMRLAQRGEISFREINNAQAPRDLLPEPIRQHIHRRTVALRIINGKVNKLLVLDGEDSIFQTSQLIEYCDLYLSCSYHSRFFHGEPFDLALPWQTEAETIWYRNEYTRLQSAFSTHLYKARPLAPIGPSMEWMHPPSFVRRKLNGLRHRLAQLREPEIDWGIQFQRFLLRWAQLMELRKEPVSYDIVLKDSLWGWPRHRLKLHEHLATLCTRARIQAELHYIAPTPHSGINDAAIEHATYPIRCGGGVAGDYETMLAQSRIGVFATGFHWGCRNIVTLSWLLGIKVLSDPFAHESWFDFRELETEYTCGDGNWLEVDALLIRFSVADAATARPRIQAAFDRLMGPEVCARQVVRYALN